MSKLYWYLFLSTCSFIIIIHGWAMLETGDWYMVVLYILNIFVLPSWMAGAIKAIKELEV